MENAFSVLWISVRNLLEHVLIHGASQLKHRDLLALVLRGGPSLLSLCNYLIESPPAIPESANHGADIEAVSVRRTIRKGT